MSKVTYQWLISENELSDSFVTSVIGRQLPETFATLLWQRGIRDEEALENFLHPSLEKLHDPFLFYDMDRAIERVQQAIIENQKILIYGDYDADGITSTTILKEALDFLGADVEFYLPNRFADGYGPNQRVYSEKINEGVQLIITVDNGVSGHEAINYANSVGVDVIVTDHHELPEQLPNAYAIIHPRHPKGHYPFKELAGVGVAFKFVCALLDELVVESLDLVAIGTIADMVSLTDENRILV
ncbi:MAG: single-stranded-DNA-specific exonuclease RecJ, partial [Enterococcus italicus]